MPSIVLIGFKNAGKTTVAQSLAAYLSYPCIDIDALLIEELNYPSIQAAYSDLGELDFRSYESKILTSIDLNQDQVVSTGAGCIIRAENRLYLSQAYTIYLKINLATALLRMQTNTYMGQCADIENMSILYEQRLAYYDEIADLVITADKLSSHEVLEQIKWQVIL